MIPADWQIRVYTSPEHGAVAHVFVPIAGFKGTVKMTMLPATEFASEPQVAADRLTAFLTAEIAREEAKREQGRKQAARMAEHHRARRVGAI